MKYKIFITILFTIFLFNKSNAVENKILFTLAVLENENYLNDNIEGRYFKKDFDFSSNICTFRV